MDFTEEVLPLPDGWSVTVFFHGGLLLLDFAFWRVNKHSRPAKHQANDFVARRMLMVAAISQ